jgi:hypothetical protein
MNVRDLKVELCSFGDVSSFIVQHHYSRSTKGITSSFCFRVTHNGQIVGAAIVGRPAMKDQITKYSENGKFQLTELRRFVMIDEAPRNSESFVLGRIFRFLRKEGVQRILSYSDPSHGHIGVIYRATGFQYLGQTPSVKVIWWNGRHFSHRSINRCEDYTRRLGQASLRLRAAIASGEATTRIEEGKFIYIKDLTPFDNTPCKRPSGRSPNHSVVESSRF